jgi:hypothetical protein
MLVRADDTRRLLRHTVTSPLVYSFFYFAVEVKCVTLRQQLIVRRWV